MSLSDGRRGSIRPAIWRRRSRSGLVLNMTAMIDVVFLLLTYFLLIAQVGAREAALGMVLPASAGSQAAPSSTDAFEVPQRPITLRVRSLGDGAEDYVISTDNAELSAAGAITGFADLTASARGLRASVLSADHRFVIRADGSARWEHMLRAASAIKDAGFTYIRFGRETPP